MKIQGRGLIKNGENEIYFKNHFVTGGLQALAFLFLNTTVVNNSVDWTVNWGFSPASVGTDTSTATNFLMTGLVAPVSNLIANTLVTYNTNYNGSQATIELMSQWPVSALPSITIGEIGLPGGIPWLYNSMFSRASVADGDFPALAYNPANSLVVKWNLIFSFV